MRLLLDTHTFLWFVWGHANLSSAARGFLTNPQNELFLSAASVWEMAIKVGLKKLVLNVPLDVFVNAGTSKYQLAELPVTTTHALAIVHLPSHHRDPFDRILVAQVTVESMAIVSNDAALDAYGVQRLW